MKKYAILSLVLGLGLVFVSAEAEAFSYAGPAEVNYRSPSFKRNNQSQYLEALRRRYNLMYNKAERTLEDKHLYNQQAEHRINRYLQNTNEVNTLMRREGELQDRSRIEPVATPRYERSNSKQTFRARAIDYYVDGGYANAEAMKSNVIYGSEHKVDTNNWLSEMYKKEVGSIVRPTRDLIRIQEKADKVGTLQEGHVGYNNRKGNFYRNFWSPAMSTKWLEE
ncbi:MAG: hypothetical protein K9M51_03245 [Candidatus Gracilibacteria bacterium]|nr:hypothetical protein [Candidatus Gracilibacteria bacterium]